VQSALYKASETQEMDSLAMVIQSVWHVAEQGEWMVESEGNLAEGLHSVERVKPSVEYRVQNCVRSVSISRQQN
jgi:hypothetical protein